MGRRAWPSTAQAARLCLDPHVRGADGLGAGRREVRLPLPRVRRADSIMMLTGSYVVPLPPRARG